MSEDDDKTILELIETVQEQGCIKMKDGREGIPRRIEFTPEATYVSVSFSETFGEETCFIEDIERIVFIG